MPRNSNSPWNPVRASAVVPESEVVAAAATAVAAVVGGAGGGVGGGASVVAIGVGPSWSFRTKGATLVGVQARANVAALVTASVFTVPGENCTGVPVPDRVNVPV